MDITVVANSIIVAQARKQLAVAPFPLQIGVP